MNKKDVVHQIQKIAQQTATPSEVGAYYKTHNADGSLKINKAPVNITGPEVSATPKLEITGPYEKKSVPNSGTITVGGLAEVKNMQLAMQKLAAIVMRDAMSATMGTKPNDTKLAPAGDEQSNSKKAFSDFIAEQYIGTLGEDKKGVEWTPDKTVTTYPGKKQTQTDIYELDVVMDTLRRIGKEKSELAADGNWDFRTDNALKNIMGFAHALLQLEGDFGLKNTIYTSNNLKILQGLLSGYEVDNSKSNGLIKLSNEEKKNRAVKIVTHLDAIAKLYSHFRQQVLARPEFRPYIEGTRGFAAYNEKGTNKNSLTQPEQVLAKDPKVRVEGLKIKSTKGWVSSVPLSALQSKETFDNFVSSLGYSDTEKTSPLILNVIKKQLEAM